MKATNELPIPTDETYWVELSEPKQERSYSKEQVENIMAETWIQCVGNDGDNFKEVRDKILNNLKTNKIMKQKSKNLEEQQEKFEKAVRPLMKYLAENHHPHTSIYVTSNTAELLEGQKVLSTNEYIVD